MYVLLTSFGVLLTLFLLSPVIAYTPSARVEGVTIITPTPLVTPSEPPSTPEPGPEADLATYGLWISVDRGEGATYRVCDYITICYDVPYPVYIRIWDITPAGSQVILEGYDDGTGGCFWGIVEKPTGIETLRIEMIEYGQVTCTAQTWFYVCDAGPLSAWIWTDRGEGSTYRIGDSMTLCYDVSRPAYVELWKTTSDGSTLMLYGYDDGRGDCFYATVGPPAGVHRYRIDAYDCPPQYRLAWDETWVNVEEVDPDPPSISNVSESDDPICKQGTGSPDTVNITAQITDPSGVAWAKLYYRLNYSSWNNVTMSHSGSTYSATIGPFSETGTVEYYIKARDNVGNEGNSSTRTVTIQTCDITPPTISNIRESNDPINKQGCPSPTTVTIRADVSDPSGLAWARLYYQPPGGSWTYATMSHESSNTYKATIGPFSETGTVEYYIKARDNVGNERSSPTYTVAVQTCDITPPYISNIRESNDPINKQGCPSPTTVTIRADVSDPSGLAWVRLYYQPPGGSWTYATMSHESSNTYKATIGPFSETGTVEYYIKARDNVGNEQDSSHYTVTVMPCPVAPNGLDITKLEPGDILMANATGLIAIRMGMFGGYWGHTAIYFGEGKIIESTDGLPNPDTPGVEKNPIDDTTFWDAGDWVVKRVKKEEYIEPAVNLAEQQALDKKPYSLDLNNKWRMDRYYCSQLVWRAYCGSGGTCSLDLDSQWSFIRCTVMGHPKEYCERWANPDFVAPDDIYWSKVHLTTVQDRDEDAKRAVLYLGSPADFYLTDPQGRHVGVDPNTGQVVEQIPEVSYYSGPDEEPEIVVITDMEGRWDVKVIGTDTGSYTLASEVVGGEIAQVDYVTKPTSPGQIDDYPITYPTTPGEPIRLTGYTIYLPLIIKNYA